MTYHPLLLLSLAALSGALHIYFDYKKNIKATYIFKPLVCALLMLLVYGLGQESVSNYRNLIFAGLLFSMFGDIFLMLKNEKFELGLASFFVAHLFYIVAFFQFIDVDKNIPWIYYFSLLIIASFVWAYLKDGVARVSSGKLKVPVIAYITVIIIMVMSARTWQIQASEFGFDGLTVSSATLAYIGALFFMASDLNLAINKFKKPYKAAQFVTLSTYYMAQILIALSVISFR